MTFARTGVVQFVLNIAVTRYQTPHLVDDLIIETPDLVDTLYVRLLSFVAGIKKTLLIPSSREFVFRRTR